MSILKFVLFAILLSACSSGSKEVRKMNIGAFKFSLISEERNTNTVKKFFLNSDQNLKIHSTNIIHENIDSNDKLFHNKIFYIKNSYEKIFNPYVEVSWSNECLSKVNLNYKIERKENFALQRLDVLFDKSGKIYLCDQKSDDYVSGVLFYVVSKNISWEIKVIGFRSALDFESVEFFN